MVKKDTEVDLDIPTFVDVKKNPKIRGIGEMTPHDNGRAVLRIRDAVGGSRLVDAAEYAKASGVSDEEYPDWLGEMMFSGMVTVYNAAIH